MAEPAARLVIGLTGGVASGKSAVADHFAGLGASIVDTDLLAREVVEPGQPTLARVVEVFGSGVLDSSGRLDRRQLRERVFADPAERQRLEALLHPPIRDLAARRVQAASGAYAMVVVPLLAERGRYPFIDRVLVVDVAPDIQLQRLQRRDGIAAGLAQAMLAAQATRAERLALADDVIDNSGPPAALLPQVEALHRRYLQLAAIASGCSS